MKKTLVLLAILSAAVLHGQQFQEPEEIRRKVDTIENKFVETLGQECSIKQCQPVGCLALDYETLDTKPNSELPGLEDKATTKQMQYRLRSAVCEFTYEPSIEKDHIYAIQQRVKQKVRFPGVQISLRGRKLFQKPDSRPPTGGALTFQDYLFPEILPFLPWMILAILFTTLVIVMLWAWRKLYPVKEKAEQISTENDLPKERSSLSAAMVLNRINQLQDRIRQNDEAAIAAIQVYLDEEDINDLCLFLDHFNPDLLSSFKGQSKYEEVLIQVGKEYVEHDRNVDHDVLWEFLERFDRNITAAKIRIERRPISEEFSYLLELEHSELNRLLNLLSKDELMVALTYSPRKIRESYFSQVSGKEALEYAETVENLDEVADRLVRQTASKLRSMHQEHSHELKTISVDKGLVYGDVINSLSDDHRIDFVRRLKETNPTVIQRLFDQIFLDESICHLPEKILADTFLTLTPQESAAYLGQFNWGATVLEQLNPRLRDHIKEFQTSNILHDQGLADRAKRKITTFIKDKNRIGQLDLREINERLLSQ